MRTTRDLSQPMVCNYRLFVKNISGDLFKAYVDPKLVEEGETACKTVFENKDSKTMTMTRT